MTSYITIEQSLPGSCISFDEIHRDIEAKKAERRERIVKEWLDLFTQEYIKNLVYDSLYDNRTSVVLLAGAIKERDVGLCYAPLLTSRIGSHKESVRERILYFLNNDEKYNVSLFRYHKRDDEEDDRFSITLDWTPSYDWLYTVVDGRRTYSNTTMAFSIMVFSVVLMGVMIYVFVVP